jgi:hypothetical protein
LGLPNRREDDDHGLVDYPEMCRPLVRRGTLPPLVYDSSHCRLPCDLTGSRNSGIFSKYPLGMVPLKRVRPTHSKRGRGHNNSNGNTIPSSSQKMKKPIVCDELLSISDGEIDWTDLFSCVI